MGNTVEGNMHREAELKEKQYRKTNSFGNTEVEQAILDQTAVFTTCFYCVVEVRMKQKFDHCPAHTIYNNTPVCGAHAVKILEWERGPSISGMDDFTKKVLNVR